MLTIQTMHRQHVAAEPFTGTPAGESAILVCTNGEIHPELATLMPQSTRITRLTVSENLRSFQIVTRGNFTIDQFVEIVLMFASYRFDDAFNRINELKPKEMWY